MNRNVWKRLLALRLGAIGLTAIGGTMFANSCSIDLPFFDEISIDVDNDDDDLEDFFDDLFDFDD
ncbi:MAG: hypothetical protein JNG88_09410 [Phycisphaerales bacterium]|nr:hypothetical protein [Phycisphaerales bacterium]